MKALVLSAGFGTRLGSLTGRLPKPMLPLAGEPLLAHTLRYLRRQGIREIAINLHYRSDTIRSYFDDGSEYDIALTYIEEPVLRGTAGAVAGLRGFFEGEEAFLVLYGDILTNQDLSGVYRFHKEKGALATLIVHRRAGSNSRVTMDTDGRIVEFVERPTEKLSNIETWVNSGIQILGFDIFEHIPDSIPSDLPRDVYVAAVNTKRLYGFPLTGLRIAIDSPSRYREAQEAFDAGLFT